MPDYSKEFARPEYVDHEIQNKSDGSKVGTLRVKPVGLSWKPVNAQKFYQKSIEEFEEWITAPATKAKRTSN